MSTSPPYEVVIGMEVHAELLTHSKQFVASPNLALAPPNTLVDPVTLGLPGALPVLNSAGVDLSLRATLALGCDISRHCFFERKHYFYPDLPKGYQITQMAKPLGVGGLFGNRVARRLDQKNRDARRSHGRGHRQIVARRKRRRPRFELDRSQSRRDSAARNRVGARHEEHRRGRRLHDRRCARFCCSWKSPTAKWSRAACVSRPA